MHYGLEFYCSVYPCRCKIVQGGGSMPVQMRRLPRITGKDAERFLLAKKCADEKADWLTKQLACYGAFREVCATSDERPTSDERLCVQVHYRRRP